MEPSESYYDPYPSLEHLGKGVFSLPGSARPIYIAPLLNDCGVCGKRIRSKWCEHLVSAGLKVDPPIVVKSTKNVRPNLLNMAKRPKPSKMKSGRKRHRPFDYKAINYMDSEETDGVEMENRPRVSVTSFILIILLCPFLRH